jgi:hypothetical protein
MLETQRALGFEEEVDGHEFPRASLSVKLPLTCGGFDGEVLRCGGGGVESVTRSRAARRCFMARHAVSRCGGKYSDFFLRKPGFFAYPRGPMNASPQIKSKIVELCETLVADSDVQSAREKAEAFLANERSRVALS